MAARHAAGMASNARETPLGGIQLGPVDYLILVVYFVFVLGIGWVLKRHQKTSDDFFLSGRSIPAWIAGLAFLSANLGAQEVIGMAASGAKYGIATSHFYWVGAIPAMVFVGIFMMPFYYGSRARSVPEYLKLRFDEKTRAFNAMSFAAMTVFSSGISMYALARLFEAILGWDFNVSILVSAGIVLSYILLGGLTSAIYNEVLQFFLIVLGFAPLVFLGLRDIGGWDGLVARLSGVATSRGFAEGAWTQSWAHLGSPQSNPMGVEWFGMAMGLGFVLSFGYWCTDFLVVQRAMAADSMDAARKTPLIAAMPKMLFPFLVILPGMIAMGLTAQASGPGGFTLPSRADGTFDYDLVIPMMLGALLPVRHARARPDRADGVVHVGHGRQRHRLQHGVDLRHLPVATSKPHASDAHYLLVGRVTTVVGIALSVATAYLAAQFNNIMDFLQLVFAFVNAPLFATFLLGMFWKRATGHGAFLGLCQRHPRRGVAPRPDAARRRHGRHQGRMARHACTCIRARWRRTSGPPSGPGRRASC